MLLLVGCLGKRRSPFAADAPTTGHLVPAVVESKDSGIEFFE